MVKKAIKNKINDPFKNAVNVSAIDKLSTSQLKKVVKILSKIKY